MLRVGVQRGQVTVTREADSERVALLGAGQTWTNVKLANDVPAPIVSSSTPQPKPTQLPTAPSTADPEPDSDPAQLLAAALRHRRVGNSAAAAAEYDRLRREHPGDARAGLAAFELARLRLDQLSDARGALEAFDAALSSGKGGFFVEDAQAGRIRALSRLRERGRCVAAQSALLKAHPESPHAAEVRRLCNTR